MLMELRACHFDVLSGHMIDIDMDILCVVLWYRLDVLYGSVV
jgi:hypothetical protein